jgi:formylglycine-generating enzyme required for sulfatase activity
MNEFDNNIKTAQKKGLTLYLVFGGVAGVVILAYLAWLMLAEGYALKISPIEAQQSKSIVVTEGFGFVLADGVYSFGGTLKITVDAQKFEAKTVQVTTSTPSTIEVVLEPSPGKILARTDPESLDTLWNINGEPVHIGEQLEHELAPGNYALTINNKFYQPILHSVQIQSEDVLNLDLKFTPVDGSMTIASVPTGADVVVNEKSVGKTPLEFGTQGGRYDVRLSKDGYEILTDIIEISYTDAQAQRKYQLEPKKGKLSISALPKEGVLLIDGKQRDLGDNFVYANQTHRVLYQRDGYYPYSNSLRLKPGEVKDIEIQLQPEKGKVILTSQPAADIYINGLARGTGSLTVKLPSVPHQIEFQKPGFRTVTKKITPSGKRVSKVNVKMLTEFEARRKEGAPLFVDTIGIQMTKHRPTAFTMGSAPNEKGRRRNEIQLPVKFNKRIWVSQHEITEAQYKRYDSSKASSNLPVTNVAWNEAAIYCNWLSSQEGLPPFYIANNGRVIGSKRDSNGYRLPTEAEWEWLSKKAKRATPTTFVWGNSSRIPAGSGNLGDASLSGKQTFVLTDYNDSHTGKAPVGSYKPDRAGLYDLAGNVSEWVHDFHSYVPSQNTTALVDYLGPVKGSNHIWKGGNFTTGQLASLRSSYKEASDSASPTLGFRIARYD